MAVYTHLTEQQIANHLKRYDLGELIEFNEIQEGVENSNFFIRTTKNRYILTLFEKRVNPKDLPYFMGVMEHLAAKNIPCPLPLKNKSGEVIVPLEGQPSVIISFLNGAGAMRIHNTHMSVLGELLGNMHRAVEDFSLTRPNSMSLPAWKTLASSVIPQADEIQHGLAQVLTDELEFLESHWPEALPTGVIHADLFPDNVFYHECGTDVKLSGVIDFYFACNDFFMYDVAVTLNAWCFERRNHHEFNVTRTSLLLKGYHHVRPISEAELEALPILARGAALRFLLTRCYDWLNPSTDALVKPKDPLEYLNKLKFHQRVVSSREYGL